jgi:hypothetical protein
MQLCKPKSTNAVQQCEKNTKRWVRVKHTGILTNAGLVVVCTSTFLRAFYPCNLRGGGPLSLNYWYAPIMDLSTQGKYH